MFGDDFKKSLEPIKTSDELLEKTRKAIEQARLEKASESLTASSRPVRRRSQMSYFLMAAVPIACVILIMGGVFFLLPKMSKSKKSDTKSKADGGKRYAKQEAAVAADLDLAVENVVGVDNYISNELSEDSPDTQKDSVDARENGGDAESERAVYDETTAGLPAEASSDKFSSNLFAQAGDYTICISSDKQSLLLMVSSESKNLLPSGKDQNDDSIPVISHITGSYPEGENDLEIIGVDYDEALQRVYITVSNFPSGNPHGEYILLSWEFKDGEFIGNEPKIEYIEEFDR
ncbi:MAG: hypothetical protein J5379_10990 [Clostridiales bacterium]|nr:hypothetical protein [Clostridiales bacterium]